MNVVFISIFDLTEVFYEISRHLEARGHTVFWIANSDKWYRWLFEKGVEAHRILMLENTEGSVGSIRNAETLYEEMRECEAGVNITFNEAILIDRFLGRYEEDFINQTTMLFYAKIKHFMQANRIQLVFAEPTNLHELVTYMVASELNIPYLAPWDMRFPGHRLVFAEGIVPSPLVARIKMQTGPDAGELLAAFKKNKPQPSYLSILNTPMPLSRYAKKVFRKLWHVSGDKHSLTHYFIRDRIKEVIRKWIGSVYLQYATHKAELKEDGEYALFPLHVQPENSIDVFDSYSSNQIELIRNIVRSLPFGMKLIVKEHPNFFGAKGYAFYREIKKIKNVLLIDGSMSNFELYGSVKVVLSVSGTSCYEAAMLGIPSVVFAPVFFDGFSTIRYVKDVKDLRTVLRDMLNGDSYSEEKDIAFLQHLLNNSFQCYWTDPLHNKVVLDAENLECLSEAFLEIMMSKEAACRAWS